MHWRRFATLVVCVALAFPLLAEKRITDLNGNQVKFGSSIAPARTTANRAVNSTSLHPTAASVTINSGPDTDAANNDYRRIQNALNAAATGDTIILTGTFNFNSP